MTRTEAIDLIRARLGQLTDERLEALAELAQSWDQPTVYASLSSTEKAEIDAALAELESGKGLPWDTVTQDLNAMIKAAGE